MEDIEKLLRAAAPGTTIEILRITVPGVNTTTIPDAGATSAPEWTPEAVVEWARGEHGEDGLKLKEWARMLPGISHRELVRAVGDGRLATHAKSSGKDHGARMASPDAMLAFLATWPLGTAL